MLRKVKEPAVWVKAQTQSNRRTGVSFFQIFSRGLVRRTIFTALLAVGAQSGYYAIFTWLPTYLKVDRHLTVIGSSGYLAIIIVGSYAGYVLSGYINEGLGRKATFAIDAIFSGLIVLVYTPCLISPGLMMVLSLPLGFHASGIFSGFDPFLSELFPTEARGAGQGFTYNFGRGVAGFGPFLVGALASRYGRAGGISLFGSAAYILCLSTLLFLPETKGTDLANASV